MKFHVEDCFRRHSWRVYGYTDIDGARRFHQANGQIITVDEHSHQEIEPLFEIDYHSAPELLTALQKAGVRPVELSKVEGVLEAQTAHLKDLQSILRKQGYMN